MDRRQFLAMLAAGGVVTATGMWMPGEKLISISRNMQRRLVVWTDENFNSETLTIQAPCWSNASDAWGEIKNGVARINVSEALARDIEADKNKAYTWAGLQYKLY